MSSNNTPWRKFYSSSKKKHYYYNIVTKQNYWTDDNLPEWWAFIWEGNSKKYINVITNQTAQTVSDIPHQQHQQQQRQSDRPQQIQPIPGQSGLPRVQPGTTTTTTAGNTNTRAKEALTVFSQVEDTPYISNLRHEFILNVRETFTNYIVSHGSLPGDTKTARSVRKVGAFKGLAGLYVRWVFCQKDEEGNKGEDPLLPSVAKVDIKNLPKELEDAGFPKEKAIEASKLLTNEAQKYVLILQEEKVKTNTPAIENKYTDAILGEKVRYDGGFVYLDFVDTSQMQQRSYKFRSETLKIVQRHYDKLCQMYKRHNNLLQNNNNNNANANKMLKRVYNVLQRYESLSGSAAGFQMALTEDMFDQLHTLYGVEHECFASPLNAYFPSYCSLFADTDQYFGSYGSFFNFFPKEGSFEANPPFVDDIMTKNVEHITRLLSDSNLPLSFVIIVPGWDDDECTSYNLTLKSPYLRQHITLSKENHQYKSGAQYRVGDDTRYKNARIQTFVFVMQNDAGMKKWPATEAKRITLMKHFEMKSNARDKEGHQSMWLPKQNNASVTSIPVSEKRKLNQSAHTLTENNRSTKTRKVNSDINITAEQHYNNQKLRAARSNISNRENHSLTFWYKFSNWCKQCLIQGHSFQQQINQISVLDLACGHGGDVTKFKRLNNVVNYVGADIAKESLLQAIQRISSLRNIPFSYRFGKANIGQDMLSGSKSKLDVFNSKTNQWSPNTELIQPTEKFHLVSMQFAFHYMMESEERLRNFFKSFAPHLIDGHYFVATTTHANTMAQELAQQPPTNSSTGETELCIYDDRNRVNCRITFPKETREALLSRNNNDSSTSSFGMTIHFELTEHRDDGTSISAVNAKEWLIPIGKVKQVAAEFGMQLIMNMRFDEFLFGFHGDQTYGPLLSKMNVAGLREHEWKLARFYTCLAFKKVPYMTRVAIIVPFRDLDVEQNRAKHLQQFIPYMIHFLSQATNISYKIFVVEQSNDGKKFNRGKLLNVGFKIAEAEGYTSFIFHDVDLLPNEELLQWYATNPQQPIHIARVWSRYNLNPNYCGGIISWNKYHFEQINGFPNNFWGWGGEDDEMMLRMKEFGLQMQAPNRGNIKDLEYMTLEEKLAFLKKQKDGDRDNKWKCMVKDELLKEHNKTWKDNGLSDLKYTKKKYIVEEKKIHTSNLAVKITVALPLNGHWSDTKTEWGTTSLASECVE